jgi:hypothetical protein
MDDACPQEDGFVSISSVLGGSRNGNQEEGFEDQGWQEAEGRTEECEEVRECQKPQRDEVAVPLTRRLAERGDSLTG